MIRKKITLFLLSAIIIAAFFSGCSCNCGKSGSELNFVKGYITVVGNEPFTKLAIKTGDDKIYVLQCSKELKEDLWRKQGSLYYIFYGDFHKELGDTIIVVEKVIPVTKGDL